MQYLHKGYMEISPGVFVKTYTPYEDGTLATEKQKTAIKNMLAYLETGDKTDHACLGKKEIARIEKLTKVEAMNEISTLINRVRERNAELMEAWDDMPMLF